MLLSIAKRLDLAMKHWVLLIVLGDSPVMFHEQTFATKAECAAARERVKRRYFSHPDGVRGCRSRPGKFGCQFICAPGEPIAKEQ